MTDYQYIVNNQSYGPSRIEALRDARGYQKSVAQIFNGYKGWIVGGSLDEQPKPSNYVKYSSEQPENPYDDEQSPAQPSIQTGLVMLENVQKERELVSDYARHKILLNINRI